MRRQRKVLHLNPKDSQFNGDDDNEEVHTHKTQIKRRKRSMRDDYEEDQNLKVILCHDECRMLACVY